MPRFIDRLRSWGGSLMDGAARAYASWQQRAARAQTGLQRPRRQVAHPAGIGERVFASNFMGTTIFGYPGGWTGDRVEMVGHFRHWAYVALNRICTEVAGLTPNVAYVNHGSQSHATQLRRWRYEKSLHAIKPHEEVEHVEQDHPLARLLAEPNHLDTAGDLWYELFLFLKLTGNAYLWVVPNQLNGQPCELWVIPSHWVWPRMSRSRVPEYWEIRPLVGGQTLHFPPEEVIHLRYKNPIHKFDGYSPLSAGSEWIDVSESIDQSRYWQFKNGAFPMGAIELGEAYQDVDDTDLERIYAKFFARFQGETNAGRPIVTPPGAKYNPVTIAPKEMMYPESADQMRDWVLSLFGVPKELVGIQPSGSDLSWYAPMLQFCRFVLQPDLRALGQTLTQHLARRWDDSLRIWWDDPTPENPEQVNKDLALDAQYGWVTDNEARAIRGREPYKRGGDNPWKQSGVIPLPLNEDIDPALQQALQGAQQGPGGAGAPDGDMAAMLGGQAGAGQPAPAGQQQEAQPGAEQQGEEAPAAPGEQADMTVENSDRPLEQPEESDPFAMLEEAQK